MPMTVLAVGSAKGGVGKSTTSLYLATYAAQMLGSTAANPVVAILDRDNSKHLSDLIHTRPSLLRSGVVLLPGEALPPRDLGYKLLIIDTPPGFAALQSLQEAELVLVPVQPEDQGVLGLVRYLDGIKRRGLVINPSLRLVALLPTMVQRVALHEQRLKEVRLVAAEHEPPLRVLTPVPRRAHIARYDLAAPEYKLVGEELFNHAFVLS